MPNCETTSKDGNGDMTLKQKMAEVLKYSYFFQKRAANEYFSENTERYTHLEEDEQPLYKKFVSGCSRKVDQIVDMMREVHITIRPESRFQTWIDTGLFVGRLYSMTDNVPPFYPIILENSIDDLLEQFSSEKGDYYKRQLILLKAVRDYIQRVVSELEKEIIKHPNCSNLKITKSYFENMVSGTCQTLEEAFQRILFWSSLFWQSQHRLVGLGRLDLILDKYDHNGVNTVPLIADFYREMHRYYAFKSSNTSLGDTGQIVIVGGLDSDGNYFYNTLTYDFIKAIKAIKLPDPKVLLRVSSRMPDDLLELALKCIETGIGCPLLANDDVIVPALLKFGYDTEDAYNYVTSACWEPLVYGNSLEKNNIKIINFAEPMTRLLKDESFETISDYKSVIEKYISELDDHLDLIMGQLRAVKWEEDPLTSLLTIGCFETGRDVSMGGAKYNDYGILSVGLTNAVNSLMNIRQLCFQEYKYTLTELKDAVVHNYKSYENLRIELKQHGHYGRDRQEVLALVNEITNHVEEKLKTFTNRFGGKVKFGLSASNYVEVAEGTGATPDGRQIDEPLRSHITCADGEPYTELFNFAAQINYDGVKSNGNVVDFFVSPLFMEQNFEKFFLLIKQAIKNGFFEMQMNVVSSETLIKAKLNPELYPNLIVRVWGFSAYFKDLPEEYQDVLIERAVQSERVA